MNIENNTSDERELLLELYRFEASDGNIYYIKPAVLAEVMSPESDFSKIIDAVGIPIIASGGNPRLFCMTALRDETIREKLSAAVNGHVTLNGEAVTLNALCEGGFTVDDIILMLKRLIGISG